MRVMRGMHHRIKVNIDDDKEEDKLKTSLFLLTINSNQVINKTTHWKQDPQVKKFNKKIKILLDNIPEYIKVNANALPDNNMNINIKAFSEVGNKQHRLHIHVIIEVKHNSNIQIDTKKITAETGYYTNVQYMRGSGDINRMLAYIRKQL
jgi:hypothetical protein